MTCIALINWPRSSHYWWNSPTAAPRKRRTTSSIFRHSGRHVVTRSVKINKGVYSDRSRAVDIMHNHDAETNREKLAVVETMATPLVSIPNIAKLGSLLVTLIHNNRDNRAAEYWSLRAVYCMFYWEWSHFLHKSQLLSSLHSNSTHNQFTFFPSNWELGQISFWLGPI